MDQLRTVSETKREFYTYYTRPINSVYRRAVEELMVEMHLLSVNVEFRYNPIFAIGLVTSYQRFMQGYQPEQQRLAIFEALGKALKIDYNRYQQDSKDILASIEGKSIEDLFNCLTSDNSDIICQSLRDIARQDRFKYSRLFAVGLYTILSQIEPDLAKNTERREEYLKKFAQELKLPQDKLVKDVDSYRSNLEKMEQILLVLEDAAEAERKKREKKEQLASSSSTDS
ncbi:MAG: photosystem II biogenesis protein Psp29 [Cyanobacteriota bacterium ELA615]